VARAGLDVAGITRDVARLAGVEREIGTLEVGKIANVVVRDGDFMQEKTTVKMVYVDGYRIDPAAKPLPPGAKPAPVKDGERR
jgi:imidazolonepropionase-like amidohydrolase